MNITYITYFSGGKSSSGDSNILDYLQTRQTGNRGAVLRGLCSTSG